MPPKRRWLVLFACASLSAATFLVPQTAGAQSPGANGKIVFESERDGNLEIYSMNPDGTHETRLTRNDAEDYTPMWSPDGSKIAFASERDGNGELYVMNADGSGQTRLTNDPGWDYEPRWSPDGTKILFETERHLTTCPPRPESWRCNELYVINADGTGLTRLTNNTSGDYDQVWSPDGTKILFESERDGNFEVYVMNADGTGQIRLSDQGIDDFDGRWSPDGTKVLFVTYRNSNTEIFSMNADGTGKTNLTNSPTSEDRLADETFPRPSWSPDGTRIVFGSDRSGGDEIYVMNADGTEVIRLTNNSADDWDPFWSPDGSRIGFQSYLDGNVEIYTMAPDGTDVTRMTNNSDGDYDPEWGSSQPSSETRITSKPKRRTADKTPTFNFEATLSGATFQCKLDAGSFKSCVSPKTYGALKNGTHVFRVRAVVGVARDPTPARFTWKITN